MNYNKELQKYLTAMANSMQSSYEWYVKEVNKKNDNATYSAATSCIESIKDDMQGAIGFAHFADLITPEQFNEAWVLSTSIFVVYSVKIRDLFFRKEGE